MATLARQTIMVDGAVASALEGVTLQPDAYALEVVMRHAVLTLSHDLGDLAEAPDRFPAGDLRRLATRLDRIAAAVEAMEDVDRKGGE